METHSNKTLNLVDNTDSETIFVHDVDEDYQHLVELEAEGEGNISVSTDEVP